MTEFCPKHLRETHSKCIKCFKLEWLSRLGHRISTMMMLNRPVLRSDKHEPHQEHRLGTVSNNITGGGGGAGV